MDATGKLLVAIDVAGSKGLEIGPLDNPRIARHQGDVHYVDHASADALRDKYRTNPALVDRLDEIVDVDHVIEPGGTISEAVGATGSYDYVIASHVLEHVPDPVGWLRDLASVLRVGGVISLVLPDKRYCFDVNRRLTEAADLIDAHLRHATHPTYAQVFDFESKIVAADSIELWHNGADYGLRRRDDVGDPERYAFERCLEQRQSGAYFDVHCHTFTPRSFLSIYRTLANLDLVDFSIAAFFPTEENAMEFFVTLELLPPTDPVARREEQLRSVTEAEAAAPDAGGSEAMTLEVSAKERRLILMKRRLLARVRRTPIDEDQRP